MSFSPRSEVTTRSVRDGRLPVLARRWASLGWLGEGVPRVRSGVSARPLKPNEPSEPAGLPMLSTTPGKSWVLLLATWNLIGLPGGSGFPW